METVKISLDEGLAALLRQSYPSLEEAVRELAVLELYRRGSISGGKAAELLGISRLELIRHASELGIPYLAMSEAEWEAEKAASDNL